MPGAFNPCGATTSIAYSPEGRFLATATANGDEQPNVHLWNLDDGMLVRDLDGFVQGAEAVAFSPDGTLLVAAGSRRDRNAVQFDIVKLYDVATGAQVRAFPAGNGFYVGSLAFSRDGTLLATAGYSGLIEVWRVADGARVTSLNEGSNVSIDAVHFAPSGSNLMAASVDGRATVWDVPSGTELLSISPIGGDFEVDATFSPDSLQIVTTGPNNAVQIWDAMNGTLLRSMSLHSEPARLLWPDLDHVVSYEWSGGSITWMTRQPSGDFVETVEWRVTGGKAPCIALSPDGKSIAYGALQGTDLGFAFSPRL
jgi:WD40 repeat protein